MKVKIIGCGNPLAGDDGMGVHVINQLKTTAVPEGVTVLEGGTDPLNILEMLRGEEKVILVDVLKGAGEPGEVFVLGKDDLELTAETGLSLHQFDLAHVLRLGEILYPGEMPEDIVVIGVEAPETTPFKIGLSPDVQAALPKLIDAVKAELKG